MSEWLLVMGWFAMVVLAYMQGWKDRGDKAFHDDLMRRLNVAREKVGKNG